MRSILSCRANFCALVCATMLSECRGTQEDLHPPMTSFAAMSYTAVAVELAADRPLEPLQRRRRRVSRSQKRKKSGKRGPCTLLRSKFEVACSVPAEPASLSEVSKSIVGSTNWRERKAGTGRKQLRDPRERSAPRCEE